MTVNENNDRDVQILRIIKSNLVSSGLASTTIEEISKNLSDDLIDFLDAMAVISKRSRRGIDVVRDFGE